MSNIQSLKLQTDACLLDRISGNRPQIYHSVYPSDSTPWNYTLLTIFLNEMACFRRNNSNSCITSRSKLKDNEVIQFRFVHNIFSDHKIQVTIFINEEIEVKVTLPFLQNGIWTLKEKDIKSKQRKGKKERTNSIEQKHYYYEITLVLLNDTSSALYLHLPLLFQSRFKFSDIFHFFAQKIRDITINNTEDTRALREYIELFIKIRNDNTINNLTKLTKYANGYIIFDIQRKTSNKKLPVIIYKDLQYYIIGGCYILPTTQSLFLEYKEIINGILMDTTWKVLPHFVTSIMMVSAKNIGLPIGFSFHEGSSETRELYESLFITMKMTLDIDISIYPVESDLGPALNSLSIKYGLIQFYCLRHYLSNLKKNPFGYEISLLINCDSEKDLEKTKEVLVKKFKQIKDKKTQKLLNKNLNNIGLNFNGKSINEVDEVKWMKVSLLKRIPFKMPSTTNSLESTHGHLNEKTPRRSSFFMGLYRIIKSLSIKIQSCDEMFKHNFYYCKKRTIDKSQLPENSMKNMIKFYNTNIDSCDCGENKLVSAMIDIKLPCSHQIYIGNQFPSIPDFNPHFDCQWSNLVIDYNILDDDNSKIIKEPYEKKYAKSKIRFYTQYTKKDIDDYVDENYNETDDSMFIKNHGVSLIEFVLDGIKHFKELKKKE